MKKRINLFVSTEKYQKRAFYYQNFKLLTLIIGAILISSLFILYLIKYNNVSKIEILESDLSQLEYRLNSKSNIQNQKYLKTRLGLINSIIDNTLDYQAIFNIINNHFAGYRISEIEVSLSKEISMKIILQDKQSLLGFLDKIQSAEFKKDFYDININKFEFPLKEESKTNLTLKIKVKL